MTAKEIHRAGGDRVRCSRERKHGCSLPRLKEAELMEACREILKCPPDPEAAFAGKVSKLFIHEDRLEFHMKEGEEHIWQRR